MMFTLLLLDVILITILRKGVYIMKTRNLEASLIKFYPTSQLVSILERENSEETNVAEILKFRLERKYHLSKGVSTLLMKRDQEILAERKIDREIEKKKTQEIKELRKQLEEEGWFGDEEENEKEEFVIRNFERLGTDNEFCEYKEFLKVIDYRNEAKDRELRQLFAEACLNDWNFALRIRSEKKKLKNVEDLDDLKKIRNEIFTLTGIRSYLYEYIEEKLDFYDKTSYGKTHVGFFNSLPSIRKFLKREGNLCECYFNGGVVSGFQKKLFCNYSIDNRIIKE